MDLLRNQPDIFKKVAGEQIETGLVRSVPDHPGSNRVNVRHRSQVWLCVTWIN
jgi:hypothetical protein